MATSSSNATQDLWEAIDRRRAAFAAFSDRIWSTPELNYNEFSSANQHAAMLGREGFKPTVGIAGIPTAMVAEAGEGGAVVAILGEFDALPGLSQQAGVAERMPVEPGGNGHGCGHNLLGAAALLAAAAVKDHLAAMGLQGRVRYIGCPAEEGGAAKGFLVRAGLFDDVDVALCWHPSAFTGVIPPASLACVEVEFRFTGRSAHAAIAPELGRSALDAMELMNVGVNYLREHMPSTARIHYALIDGGGRAPNVVQATAAVRYLIRAASLGEMWSLFERVAKVAQGAALMTETAVIWTQLSGEANLVGNRPLETAMDTILRELGSPPFDDADRAFAASIRETLGENDVAAAWARFGLDPDPAASLSEGVYPLGAGSAVRASTDVGTVSWVVPTAQCHMACYAIGTPGHSWQLVAQGCAPAAHKGMAQAAKAMAALAVRVLEDDALRAAAREAHRAFRAKHDFKNPIGDTMAPPLTMGAP